MTTIKRTCDCCDSGCPAHKGKSECTNQATVSLRRIDFAGQPIVWFCNGCAEDALDSGVFA
jgi:hypothetical protein